MQGEVKLKSWHETILLLLAVSGQGLLTSSNSQHKLVDRPLVGALLITTTHRLC